MDFLLDEVFVVVVSYIKEEKTFKTEHLGRGGNVSIPYLPSLRLEMTFYPRDHRGQKG